MKYPAKYPGLPVVWKERRRVFLSRAEAANFFKVSSARINQLMKSGRRAAWGATLIDASIPGFQFLL